MLETVMQFDQIAPFVRHAKIQHFGVDSYPSLIRAYDCRLFYVLKGTGFLTLDNTRRAFSPGDLALWQPGVSYRMGSLHAREQLTLITINFDFTHNHAQKAYPIPPELSSKFRKEDVLALIWFTDAEWFNRPVLLSNMHFLELSLQEMVKEYATRKNFYLQRINGLMLSTLGHIARQSALPSQYATDKSVNLIIRYIHRNYAEELTNAHIGAALNFHPNYVNKLMVLHTGSSLHKYLLSYRISKAIELIENTDSRISEVAYATGFRDACHFSKYFKKVTGLSPSDYQRIKRRDI